MQRRRGGRTGCASALVLLLIASCTSEAPHVSTGAPARASSSSVPDDSPSPSPASTTMDRPSPQTPPQRLEIRRTVDGNGWVVLPDAFGIWVAGPGTLTRIDPRTGATTVTARGPWDYDYVRLAEYGEGTIFIATGSSRRHLIEMDARSGTVLARIDVSALGYVDAVLALNGGVWVTASGARGSQVLAEIDPDTGHIERRQHRIGQGLHGLIEAGGYLFVISNGYHGGTLSRVDPRTVEVTRIPGVPPGAAVAGVGSHVWWGSSQGAHCIDALALQPCGHVDISGYIQMASFERQLWVVFTPPAGSVDANGRRRSKIVVIDGRDGSALAGPLRIPGRPSSIAAFGHSAWLGYYRNGTVTEVDRCDPERCRSAAS
jgi:hypothetical protein